MKEVCHIRMWNYVQNCIFNMFQRFDKNYSLRFSSNKQTRLECVGFSIICWENEETKCLFFSGKFKGQNFKMFVNLNRFVNSVNIYTDTVDYSTNRLFVFSALLTLYLWVLVSSTFCLKAYVSLYLGNGSNLPSGF